MCRILILTVLTAFSVHHYSSAQISGAYTDPSTGTSLRLPDGWVGQAFDGGLLLGSQSKKGFILITPHDYSDLDQIRAEAVQGIVDNNGTALYPEGELRLISDNALGGIFQGTVEWQEARAYAAGIISPYGGGLTVLAAVEKSAFNPGYEIDVKSIIESVTFRKPQVAAGGNSWKEKLSDCRLTYMNSYNSGYGGGGYQDKTIIDLCSQGYFKYYDHSETVINAGDYAGGYSTGSSSGSGTWSVTSRGGRSVLKLSFHGGEVYEYALSEEDGKTFLDGNRYFRTYGSSAVEEGRPACP